MQSVLKSIKPPLTLCLHTHESNHCIPSPYSRSEIKLNCFFWLQLLVYDWHVAATTSILWQLEYLYRSINLKLCVWNEKWSALTFMINMKKKTIFQIEPNRLQHLNTNLIWYRLLCSHGSSSMWGVETHPTLPSRNWPCFCTLWKNAATHTEHYCLFGKLWTD